jgi:hypothetical protein
MSFIVGQPFARNYIYSDEELNAITPAHVFQWMNFRTFGTVNPAVDANPISVRSSSLQYWKKAVSFFRPNRLMVWSAGRKRREPDTQHRDQQSDKESEEEGGKETGRSISDSKGDHRIGILYITYNFL